MDNLQELRNSFDFNDGGFDDKKELEKTDTAKAVVERETDPKIDELIAKLDREFEENEDEIVTKEVFVKLVREALITKRETDSDPTKKEVREKAKAKLREYQLDVDYITGKNIKGNTEVDIRNRQEQRRKVLATLTAIENGEMTKQQQLVLETMIGVGIEEVLKSWGVEVIEDDVDETRDIAREKKKDGKFSIRTMSELSSYVRAVEKASPRASEYRQIINRLGKEGEALREIIAGGGIDPRRENEIVDLISSINKQIGEYQKRMGNSDLDAVEGDIPKNSDPKDWIKWLRGNLAPIVEPFLPAGVRNRKNFYELLKVTVNLPGGKQERQALNLAPDIVQQVMNEKDGEINVITRLGSVFDEWRNYRTELKKMTTSAFEDGSRYELPNNELNDHILRELRGDNGALGVGAENVGIALRIYWAMANPELAISTTILREHGLDSSHNLFNRKFSADYVKKVREHVGNVCGGAYYENLGMMYANFFGLVAKGNNGKESSLSDGMAVLYNVSQSKFLSEPFKKSMTVAGSAGKESVSFMPSLAELQIKAGGEKKFYFVKVRDDEYIIQEKPVGGEVDSGLTLEDFVRSGEVWKINWQGGNFDLMAELKKRESLAVKMNNLFSEFSKENPSTLVESSSSGDNESSLHKTLKTISDSLAHYDKRTKQRVCFLWLWTQMKNNPAWLEEKNKKKLYELMELLRDTRNPLRKGWDWVMGKEVTPGITEADFRELSGRFPVDKNKASRHYGKKGVGFFRNSPLFGWAFKEIEPKVSYQDRSFFGSTKREALAMGGVLSFTQRSISGLYRFTKRNTSLLYKTSKERLKKAADKVIASELKKVGERMRID